MGNLRRMTATDHYCYAKRLQQTLAMLAPVTTELMQDYGARSEVGRAAQRLADVQTILANLQHALNDAFVREGHSAGGKSPYTQSAGAPSSPSGG